MNSIVETYGKGNLLLRIPITILLLIGLYIFSILNDFIQVSTSIEINFYTGFVLFYNLIELFVLYKNRSEYFFLKPILWASLSNFGLVFGALTNVFLFDDSGDFLIMSFGQNDFVSNSNYWISKTMLYACYASLFMWLGYYSSLGYGLYNFHLKSLRYDRIFSGKININNLIFLTIFAYVIKLYLYNIGLYGRTMDQSFFTESEGYKLGSQFRILGSLSYLTFLVISYKYFNNKKKPLISVLFMGSLVFELLFAFVYGARGVILIPFGIIFLTYYYSKKVLSLKIVGAMIVALYMAFTLMADFKAFTLSQYFKKDANPLGTISNFIEARDKIVKVNKNATLDALSTNILASTNFVDDAAVGIWFKDTQPEDKDTPPFIRLILTAPLTAFIPTFITGLNPHSDMGYWYRVKVAKINPDSKSRYSMAMTPLTYLYFAGGLPMILLGFFMYGVTLKLAYSFIRNGVVGLVVFISLFEVVYTFDSGVHGFIINFIRALFIYSLVFYVILSLKFKSDEPLSE